MTEGASLGASMLADRTILGSSRLLVEFPLECYELTTCESLVNMLQTTASIPADYGCKCSETQCGLKNSTMCKVLRGPDGGSLDHSELGGLYVPHTTVPFFFY